jgi:hypothetical protein
MIAHAPASCHFGVVGSLTSSQEREGEVPYLIT